MSRVLRNYEIQEAPDDEVDYEFLSPNQHYGAHGNLIPMPGTVQGTRVFYGGRFFNQALPVQKGEAPLVQSLIDGDEQGRSFDDHYGQLAGAMRADDDYEVLAVQPNQIKLRNAKGETVVKDLYDRLPFNRKSQISHRTLVQQGQQIKAGDMLAASNFTDDNGTLAMGLNARIGIVPYKGYSMDDAVVISQSFANRLKSQSTYTYAQDKGHQNVINRNHYQALFPDAFTKEQLATVDADGVVKEGTVVQPGDPLILATRPRVLSSQAGELGKLSKTMRQVRSDASHIWDESGPATVMRVAKTKKGVKVVLAKDSATKKGDKITLRHGQKGTVSLVIPDEQMPRTVDGEPLEVLLNPQGLPSRANLATLYEILLGKIAKKTGQPYKLPMFMPPEQNMYDFVEQELAKAGITDTEEVFDPMENRKLEQPITVGVGYIQKLHHTSACYDDQTEVLTQEGWKFWKDVTDEDYLATSDSGGHELRFERPLHLVSYAYRGTMFSFQGRYVDYCVTPNHMMWCKPYYGRGNFRLRIAADLHGKRWQVRQFGLAVSDTEDDRRRLRVGEHVFDWGDFCELVGWWAAEGCLGTEGTSVVVYQSQPANPEKVARIEALLKRLQVDWGYHLSAGEVMGFRIKERTLVPYFRAMGEHCDEKRLPRELLTGPAFGCRRMVEALVLGDGSHAETPTGPSTRFGVTSKQLIDDFQEAAIRAGWGSVVRYNVKEGRKDAPHHKDIHHASLTKTRGKSQLDGDRAAESFQMVPYDGVVYCAEMSSGLLYVRRNGKPLLSGNSKVGARGQGSYDQNEQPAKGGREGAKRLSGLEVSALMSSGAYATLREGATIRGQKNDEYWRTLREGNTPRDPDEPFAWRKFRALMTGAGMQMKDEPKGVVRLGPMTDKALDAYGPMEIHNSRLLNMKTFEPEEGGLFDKALVGNNKWGQITLPEPIVNPAFEGSVRHLLGLKLKDLHAIMAGEMDLPADLQARVANMTKQATIAPPVTGPYAIQAALQTVDLDALEKEQRTILHKGLVSKRRGAVQVLNAIEGLRRNEVEPADLMVRRVPVVPPAFRPFAMIGDAFVPGDANELYRDLFDMREAYRDAQKTFGDAGAINERKALQGAVKAVYGYGDPVNPKSRQRGVAGFLRQISGSTPKFSYFQRKLVSKTQDQVARGVITPNPEFNMDQIGVPESMAWDMYKTYVMRRLVRRGMNRREALKHLVERSKHARDALLEEMQDRHVIYSRSPAWHKFNIISAEPQLIDGDTIQISPFVAPGLGADYDGDTVNLHVPASPEGVAEARDLLKPSKMLFSIKDRDQVVPKLVQEQVLGPFAASRRPARAVHRFPSREEALRAIRHGRISLRDEVEYPEGTPTQVIKAGMERLRQFYGLAKTG